MKQMLCLRTKYDYKYTNPSSRIFLLILLYLFSRYLLTNSSSDIQKNDSLDEVINAMGLLNFTDKVLISEKKNFFYIDFSLGTTFHVSYFIWYINNW